MSADRYTTRRPQSGARDERRRAMLALVFLLIVVILSGWSHNGNAATYEALTQEALDLAQQGRHTEALSKAEEALAIQKRVLGADHPVVRANVLEAEAVRLYQEERYAEALPKAREVLRLQEELVGKSDPRLAVTLTFLGGLFRATGDFSAARSQYERALQIREEALGPNHPDVATTRTDLSVLLLAQAETKAREVDAMAEERRYAEAAEKAQEVLQLQEQAVGPDHLITVKTVARLGTLLISAQDYPKAKPLLQRVLCSEQDAMGLRWPLVTSSLGGLALILMSGGHDAEARPLLERELEIEEQHLGPNHPRVAETLKQLAVTLKRAGDYRAARSQEERALEIEEQAFGEESADVALTLLGLAGDNAALADYVTARQQYERALRILEHTHGSASPDLVLALNGLAIHLNASGDFRGATAVAERAVRISEESFGPSSEEAADALYGLGLIRHSTGDYARARQLYERALTIMVQIHGPTHNRVAPFLRNLGDLSLKLGDYAGARQFYERALEIQERPGAGFTNISATLVLFARLADEMGDQPTAKAMFERAIREAEQAHGPNHPEVATALSGLSVVLMDLGEAEAAFSLQLRAIEIREAVLGAFHPDVAISLGILADFCEKVGDFPKAFSLRERSWKIQEAASGPDDPEVFKTLYALVATYVKANQPEKARQGLEDALAISEGMFGPDHPQTSRAVADLALVDWMLGRYVEAAKGQDRALEIERTHTKRAFVGLSVRQKLAFFAKTAATADVHLSLPTGVARPEQAYAVVLNRKNAIFRSLADERALLAKENDPAASELLRQYATIARQLAATDSAPPTRLESDGAKERYARLTQELERAESQLSSRSAVFRQAHSETPSLTDLCGRIPKDAAFVEYFSYRHFSRQVETGNATSVTPHYVAFVLRGGECEQPFRVDLGLAAPINELVGRFREAVSREEVGPAERKLRNQYRQRLATRLGEKVFPPALREVIAGKARLIIAPDGALTLVPFALLPGEDGHEFLLETRTISYIPSGRDLVRGTDQAPAAPGLFAVGSPAFDRVPNQVAKAATVRAGCGASDEPFAPLPGTASEIRTIAAAYKQIHPAQPLTILEGARATKAALVEQAPRAGILHLATHAYFAGEECTPAGLAQTPGPQQGFIGDAPAFLGHNPLLLAGIALAGANERERADGILTALEITGLDLRNTDLVVLSACDTGLGTLARGQELLGLRWAFAYAGAKHIVTSLWTVPDAETATLMGHFYATLWGKGLPVAEALRAAQLEILHAQRARGDSAPHAWGAFLASGVPN